MSLGQSKTIRALPILTIHKCNILDENRKWITTTEIKVYRHLGYITAAFNIKHIINYIYIIKKTHLENGLYFIKFNKSTS